MASTECGVHAFRLPTNQISFVDATLGEVTAPRNELKEYQ